ncbi:hypothetical protein [Sphingobacterium paludis]|uniref:hypothetical protein n=1 Tax=Sphingobacterium paludis TaxID=1476465 RepID=UPI00105DB1C3|nr:hypothetical protein [Sphingobacterium paludis]
MIWIRTEALAGAYQAGASLSATTVLIDTCRMENIQILYDKFTTKQTIKFEMVSRSEKFIEL